MGELARGHPPGSKKVGFAGGTRYIRARNGDRRVRPLAFMFVNSRVGGGAPGDADFYGTRINLIKYTSFPSLVDL